MFLDTYSLGKTLDNLNEAFLFDQPVNREEGLQAVRWIITQQGKKGSYRGLFAPTEQDFASAVHLFTGEKLKGATVRHILGQEAARVVWLLGKHNESISSAYHEATGWMQAEPYFHQTGMYCCGRCSLAYWRHFWVGDFIHKEELIEHGLSRMKAYRKGDGTWHRFPFFYAIYTLVDLPLSQAREEMQYARPVMEAYVKRNRAGEYAPRRLHIIHKALEAIS